MSKIRFQDYTMEQSLGIAVRAILRIFPLMRMKEDADSNEINNYLGKIFEIVQFLMQLSIGNLEKEEYKNIALEYYAYLQDSKVLDNKYSLSVEPLFLILDQVSGQNSIRVFERPGLQDQDKKNMNISISCDVAEQAFQKAGLKPDIFKENAFLDYQYLNDLNLNDTFLDKTFYNRPLWVYENEVSKMSVVPIWNGIIIKEWEDYLNQYFLSGIISSYKGLLDGIRLKRKIKKDIILEEELIIDKPSESNKTIGWLALVIALVLIFLFLCIFILKNWNYNFVKSFIDWADTQTDFKKDIILIPIGAIYTGTLYLLGNVFYKNVIKGN